VAALRLQNLRKSFGGLPAISNVSLEVAPGERRLIIGPNGAGKTTLFNLVTGDLPRDAGNVVLFEKDVTRLAPHHRVHRGLARTYQIITLFPKDTLEHNIALSLLGLSRLRWNAPPGSVCWTTRRLPRATCGPGQPAGEVHRGWFVISSPWAWTAP